MIETEELIGLIKNCAKEVRRLLTPGFEETVYKNALFVELRNQGLSVQTEVPLKVTYKGLEVGSYRADMIVDNRVLVELKATSTLTPLHEVQLVNYFTKVLQS